MGGINCPPHEGVVSVKMKKQYSRQLATYCKFYFAGLANFNAANMTIEMAVLNEGSIANAVDLLSQSAEQFKVAAPKLGTVASMAQVLPNGSPDFVEQIERLNKIERLVTDASLELGFLTEDHSSIQMQIWSRPVITECLTEAATEMSLATDWQCKFAKASSPAAVAA